MKSLIPKYLIPLLLLTLWACSDDLIIPDENPSRPVEEASPEGSPIDVWLEDDALRTRNVQFGQGTSVRVNSVWLGVFDAQNGNLVAADSVRMGYAFLTSGTSESGVIRHNLGAPSAALSSGQGYFMVAVVNYNMVNGYKSINATTLRPLNQLLHEVKTWDDFNAIGVDTESAYYEGDEDDSGHSSDAPVMAGFLHYDPVQGGSKKHPDMETHTKVDQFATPSGNQKVLLSPSTALSSNALVFSQSTSSKDYNLTDYTLYLRRLVANINVNIIPDTEAVEITKVSYKVFNTPKSVYIIERRMLDNSNQFPTNAEKSPNFSDNKTNGYSSNEYWNETPAKSGNNWSFSFQHFANKHWARTQPRDYAQRESTTYDGNGEVSFFNALASGPGDINNNASYIVLRMYITDKKRNRCAQTEYIIHEGFTSNAEGLETNTLSERLCDFSVARNVNYTYNITVKGIDNIYYNVNATGDNQTGVEDVFTNEVTQHRPDQQGNVWNMIYAGETKGSDGSSDFGFVPAPEGANESSSNPHGYFRKYLAWDGSGEGALPAERMYDNDGYYYPEFITFDSDNPNITFRIYGYNSAAKPGEDPVEGYNYNFDDETFQYLNNLWPPSAGNKSHYFQDYDAMVADYLDQVGKDKEGTINTQLFYTFMFRIHNNGVRNEAFYVKGHETIKDEKNNQTLENDFEIDLNEWQPITRLIQALKYLNGSQKLPAFDLRVSSRELSESLKKDYPAGNDNTEDVQMQYVRALYIGDKVGKTDADGCSVRQNIYAAIQGLHP